VCFSSQQDVFDLIAGCWQVVKVSEAGAGGLRRISHFNVRLGV
jgi:hypothetical protein